MIKKALNLTLESFKKKDIAYEIKILLPNIMDCFLAISWI